MKFATKAIRIGQGPEPATGAVTVPIYQTANFVFESVGKHRGYEYTRTGNPTRSALEQSLAALEGGPHALAFASGMAATDAVLSVLRPGDHLVSGNNLYGGTHRLLELVYKPRGIRVSYVDSTDPAALTAAVEPATKMLWVETPANPWLQLTDIAAAADTARRAGVPLVVDNTFCSPFLQRPIEHGADVVLHSATKYIAGHSDVISGAVVTTRPELHEQFAEYQNTAGAVPGPFDCWLALRGIKTLALRMRQHCENAGKVAEFLEGHGLPTRVTYPGLASHPQHALASRQMDGFGGMVSFELPGGLEQVTRFAAAVRVMLFAESLGGVESLVCHPETMSHAAMAEPARREAGITPGTIRLSVGIEDADDLIEDLGRALTAAAG